MHAERRQRLQLQFTLLVDMEDRTASYVEGGSTVYLYLCRCLINDYMNDKPVYKIQYLH